MSPKEFWGTNKPVVVIDIDGTLCEDGSFPDYSNAKPRPMALCYLRDISKKCFVVLWSARYEADREITAEWLKKNDAPYDRLVLGKLPYDYFIDENAFKYTSNFVRDICSELP